MLMYLLAVYLIGFAFCLGWRGKELSTEKDLTPSFRVVILLIYCFVWPVCGTLDVVNKIREMGFTWERIKNCR